MHASVPVNVTATHDAPGEVSLCITHEVWVDDGDPLSVDVPVGVRFSGAFTVEVMQSEATSDPQTELVFPLNVMNLSNARATFTFEVVSGGDKNGGVVVPAPIIPEAKGQEGSQAVVKVRYATPFKNGANDVRGALAVSVHAASAKSGEAAQQVEVVELVANTEGFYVPGPGLALIVVALAALTRHR